MPWIDVAARESLGEGQMLEVEAAGEAILLYRIAGSIYATSAICPHHHAFLSMGSVEGDCINCPRHFGQFHIPTGRLVRGPTSPPLPVYPAEVRGERIFIAI